MKTSEKRITSLQGTNGPSPMCPLFGGFTVHANQTAANTQGLLSNTCHFDPQTETLISALINGEVQTISVFKELITTTFQ